MTKAECNKLAATQLTAWKNSNREPGVLPAIPVILISSLTGDKPGITLNFVKGMKMDAAHKVLVKAAEIAQKRMAELQ
jgi:hypothetical protein